MAMIKVENLSKVYKIPKKRMGKFGTIRNIFSQVWEEKVALNNISFSVDEGEILGYIGLNGAGKSTTLKILTGVLYPTSGNVLVNNRVPHKNRVLNAKDIAFIAGQNISLEWDLPVVDSLQLTKRIYQISDSQYYNNIELFDHLINLKEIMDVPVRQLSLGQKMRAGMANALLHNPKIIYLDEPTIGIDVVAKESIRSFLKGYNKETKATIIMTSHDTRDIEDLCGRIIMINKGELQFEGTIDMLNAQYMKYNRIINVQAKNDSFNLNLDNIKIKKYDNYYEIYYNCNEISTESLVQLISEFDYDFEDVIVRKPNMEEIIKFMHEINSI